jgi:pyrimidine-nucleoside phosphorylase
LTAGDLIAAKRRGTPHSRGELEFLIRGVGDGSIPDYQVAAWLMAAAIRGLSSEETSWLTLAMAASGEMLDLRARWPESVDKHSTGGVGDKTSLVLMPMLAAAGSPVAKMSGRGLGFSGGTADKLEAIPSLRTDLSRQELLDQVERIGIAMAAQSSELAPADGRLYALRHVTGTVDSLPLIAASIMSKKLAFGAGQLILDVKAGSGAFMKTLPEARELAEIMVGIGNAAGIRTAAVISDMTQPEGWAIGNALEVREAIETLRGRGPSDVLALCTALAAALGATGAADTAGGAVDAAAAAETIGSGAALAKFKEMVAAQGGDPRVMDEPELLPAARLIRNIVAEQDGWVAAIDAEALGRQAVALGAGRQAKDDPIDPAVGLVLKAKVGDRVERGQPLLEVHANEQNRLNEAVGRLPAAYTFSHERVPAPEQILAVLP